MKKLLLVAFIICLIAVPLLSGCGESTPVESFAISNQELGNKDAIENAVQPAEFTADRDIFACVSFIESPKGIKYTAAWILDGRTVKSEDKEMVTEPRGVIVYTLEKEKVRSGALRVQILYKDEVLAEKEVTVK
jgi:hypothetical protein